MKKLSKAETGYIAGIIDGEGYIGAFPCVMRIKGRTPYWRYETRLIVVNTKLELIRWLRDITGCGVVYACKVENRSRVWRWQVTTNQSKDVLQVALPYLIVKKKQAELLLKLRQRINEWKVGGNCGWYHPLDKEEHKKRLEICQQIKELNKRFTRSKEQPMSRKIVWGLSGNKGRGVPAKASQVIS